MINLLRRLMSAPMRPVNSIVVGLAAILATLPVGGATLYKWVDENGNVTYQDQPPPEGMRAEERPLPSADDAAEPATQAAEADPSLPRPMIFVVPECEPCELMRAFLSDRGIDFVERDAADDPTAQRQLERRAGSLRVPTLVIGDSTVQGYDPDAIEAALREAGYPERNPENESVTESVTEDEPERLSAPQQ